MSSGILSSVVGKKDVVSRSTREGYGDGLLNIGSKKNVVALSADLAESTKVALFANKYPAKFFQVGVAEQNMVTVASGLAHVGKIPFASSFAAFSPGRNLEQIRTTVCYNDLPVKICSTHAGLGVGPDGATHQALEDVAQMRSMPNMTVVCPADYNQAFQAVNAIYKWDKPVYLRLNRQKTKELIDTKIKFEIGKAQVLMSGSHVTIISFGPILSEVLDAAIKLNEEGISTEVLNLHTIKPLDVKAIIKSAKKTGFVVTVEDHVVQGGMGGAVSEVLCQNNPVPMRLLGVDNAFGESGEYEELLEKHGLTSDHIFKEVETLLSKF